MLDRWIKEAHNVDDHVFRQRKIIPIEINNHSIGINTRVRGNPQSKSTRKTPRNEARDTKNALLCQRKK
ncbi:hypothetical protein [Cognaticolwellia beringensis]|uniref:Uncharacterized protein n=1 Tax=Cognaticolwellia beringensis TaxID=1967665 RepID=A0A222G5G7_9GAMM|nr:hypothetical protein [Cognaticolwellia beringensis]ASP47146.1 hypothetical protein B5D82_04815 [Cognaticolwellia beringensis]